MFYKQHRHDALALSGSDHLLLALALHLQGRAIVHAAEVAKHRLYYRRCGWVELQGGHGFIQR
jgi:hypothetical protein